MKISRSAAAALTLSCLATAVAPSPAAAYTLLDMLRGNVKNGRLIDRQGTTEQYAPAPSRMPGTGNAGSAAASTPKVTGPRYYTYKPDAVRRIAFRDNAAVAVPDSELTTGSVTSDPDLRSFLSSSSVLAPATVADAVEAYYSDGGAFVWVEDGGVNERARAALAVLADAGAYGLDADDYAVVQPALSGEAGADAAALSAFEIELSARVLAYVEDAQRGRVDPNRISGYHDFARKKINLAPVLKIVKASPDVTAYLVSRQPSSAHFAALKAELARLKSENDESHRVRIDLERLLRPGQSNPELANIVEAIRHRGSAALKAQHAEILSSYAGSPDYAPELVDLVKDFQQEAGLKPDGVVGAATVRALVGDSNDAKIAKVVVAMEQARWLPNDLGSRHVFINQPAYTASYFEGGAQQFSMRVVIGSKANQTYFFQDQIETVEVNPYWGVPQSIIINEMLPKLRADPSYLDRMGYEVALNGRAVPSSSVNWYGSTSGLSVRQPPSSDNALGELKILFPNAHAIYMHDTPSKSFFNRDMRALSHGCVRLAEPRRMAAAVLGVTEEDVGKQIDAGRNRALRVTADIPVYIAYFTAWPDEQGVIHYYDDVYDRDSYVQKAFSATSKARLAS
ncbi:L,D-transpeptidase family protein [Rhizobiaceae bacterium BDR2-2]|uniref:L,D-transpeptidase family protein n=1 Tax=Ectorhizobium quercum TaxID=2965071 RepID=A0AAE3SYR9_9HYPH|nr:L,D-transpeptidase family protein [Ectorhizobium quercum]MCX8999835.1 L,D-transpeptidase family protein [Ectorhizobium quercum]